MINYLLAGLLGMVFFFLGQANETKKDFKAANQPFVFAKFLRDELISIAMHLVALLILAITVNEWGPRSGKAKDFTTCIFALGGIIGPWFISIVAGGSKKYFRAVVDIKANAFDNELGKSSTITELKQKAAEAGKDISTPIN